MWWKPPDFGLQNLFCAIGTPWMTLLHYTFITYMGKSMCADSSSWLPYWVSCWWANGWAPAFWGLATGFPLQPFVLDVFWLLCWQPFALHPTLVFLSQHIYYCMLYLWDLLCFLYLHYVLVCYVVIAVHETENLAQVTQSLARWLRILPSLLRQSME